MCANQTYEFTLEDENDGTEYNKIMARVKAKVFDQANIEVLSVVTNRM